MNVLLALQDAPVVPVPAVVTGLNWEVLIPLIFAGAGLLLTQILTYLKSRDTNKKTDVIAEQTEGIADTNVQQDVKLQRIEVLVNGRYGEVLQELADVKRLLAAESGRTADATRADQAQQRADLQAARVAAAADGPSRVAGESAVAEQIEKIDATTERIEGKIDAGESGR